MTDNDPRDADADVDPYTLGRDRNHDDRDDDETGVPENTDTGLPSDEGAYRVFFADEVADAIEERDPDEPIVIKGGVSPSGVPHLGHANEVLRGYFVAEVLRERGHEVRQVFTSDDKDPLRAVPRRLATLEFDLVGLSDVPDPGVLGRNLGVPLTDVPDPFECECDSFGAHQTELLRRSAERLNVPIEIVSNAELYSEGAFEDVTRTLLDRRERAREVLSDYQSKVTDEYVPFNPVCENCGKITETVSEIDLDAGSDGSVSYVCTDLTAGNQVIEGCGHEGTATLREGKLPWRFEWPAQWDVLEVDFEPFGKDHAEGSWPSGVAIAEDVLGTTPPVPMVYEWFTLDGESISSSAGTVITVPEALSMLEVPVLKYFFAKDPTRARDFSVARLDLLVDEFDRFERIYFGEVESESERRRAERVYPFVVSELREDRIRIPYTFAAVLGMTDDPDLRIELARRQGHLPADAESETVTTALSRVDRARTWAERVDNAYNYRLATDLPHTDFDAETGAALDDLAAVVESIDPGDEGDEAGEEIQGTIYETARAHDIEVGDFFAAGYRLFFEETQGPQLGPFLAELDREFVIRRLRREA